MDTWSKHRRDLATAVVATSLVTWVYVSGRSVPLLSNVDLGFHELGHMLAIPLGTVVHFLAGSITQILVPIGLALYFWRRGDGPASGLMLAWASTSSHNVSVYIADAPHRRLPLIGGTHDWWFLLGRWDLLDLAAGIAGLVWFVGLLIGMLALATCLLRPVQHWRGATRSAALRRRFASAPRREVRNPPPVELEVPSATWSPTAPQPPAPQPPEST